MAKYITVICKVKGQTILRLIDDFESVEDNVFYHNDCEDQTQNSFDLNLVKQEVEEEEIQPNNKLNENSCEESQESEDYFDERKTFSHFWDDVNSGDINDNNDNNDNSDDNQPMDSYKKHMSVSKTEGRQMFYCKSCEYQTLWKNAVVNHIRSNHLFFFPFVCGFPDCGKKFAIRSNLNNHRKVHLKRSAFRENFEESSQSSADIDHNYSQNAAKNKTIFTQKSIKNFSSIGDNKNSFAQNIQRNTKKFGKLESKPIIRKKIIRKRVKKNKKEFKKVSNVSVVDSQSTSNNVRPSSGPKPAFVGIKSVEQYIKKTERNGELWRSCLFPDCKYGTKYSTSMLYHIRNNHLNDKPYVCPTCGKRFAMRTNLNNHKKVHKTAKL